MFSGLLPASHEIWIFGDELLTESLGWLKKLEFAHLTDEAKPKLYIHENYNIRTYNPAKEGEENFIKDIRNEIATTVTRRVLFPSKILIMLSSARLDNPVFAIERMEGLLCWLLDEIDDIIKFQKGYLPDKSKKLDSPKIYFLKILPKPTETANANFFKGVRRKFNNMLQSMLQAYHGFGFINVHEISTRTKDERFFISNESGKLSDEGTIQLWESISQTVKAIDCGNKPKTMTKNQQTQWDLRDFQKDDTNTKDHRHQQAYYQSNSYRRPSHSDKYYSRDYYNDQYYY